MAYFIHDEAKFLLRVEGGGGNSYDDRGLWCYQPCNDGGGGATSSMMKVCGATVR